MHFHSRRRLFALIWAVLFSFLLSACVTINENGGSAPSDRPSASEGAAADGTGGNADDGSGPVQRPPEEQPRRQAPNQPPGPPGPIQPPPQEAVVLEWLPIGPVGRADPAWFVALKDQKCGSLEGSGEPFVEETAMRLCQGLDGKNQAAWEIGASKLIAMEPPPSEDCYSSSAYRVLRQLVDFRAKNPNVPFKLAPGRGTACEPTLESLKTFDKDADVPVVSVCAGDAIVLVGALGGLPAGSIRTVNVGATTATVQYRGDSGDRTYPFGEFYFPAPPQSEAGSATPNVTIALANWNVTGSASFEYAVDQSACPGFVPPEGPAQEEGAPPEGPAQPGTIP